MINKELLSEVLSKDIEKLWISEYRDDEISYSYKKDKRTIAVDDINMHHLAFLCKKWAYTKYKYRLITGQHRLLSIDDYWKNINNDNMNFYCCVYYVTSEDCEIQINAKTEIEAIFKACEWILKNK